MDIENNTEAFLKDFSTDLTLVIKSENVDVMMILSTTIASVGIIANFTVVVVFLSHRKLRRKIPNIFIINQVSCL